MAIVVPPLPKSEAPGAVIRNGRSFGWRPQLPDFRDKVFKLPPSGVFLPESVSLVSLMPPVLDQGRIGSCVSNAIAIAIQYLRRIQHKPDDFVPSRLFNYYNTRAMEKTIEFDAGAIIRDAIKVIAVLGAPREYYWSYVDTPPDRVTNMWRLADKPRIKPVFSAFALALRKKTVSYEVVPRDLPTIKSCLASGFPFIMGFSVYESFMSNAVTLTGTVPMPTNAEDVVGGHAVLCVGYDNSTRRFTCRNSWGANWGAGGNFTIPYDYLVDSALADDFWTIRMSE